MVLLVFRRCNKKLYFCLPSIQAESYPDTFVRTSDRDCSPEVMQTKLCNKGHFLIATRNATCDNASTESGCLRKNNTQAVNGYRSDLNLRALGILDNCVRYV